MTTRSDVRPAPQSHLRGPGLWRALAAGLVALFVVKLAYFVFQDIAEGVLEEVPNRVFEEITGVALAAPLFVAALALARRMPLARPLRRGTVPVWLASFVIVSLLHTTAMIVVRAALGPRLGLTGYDYAFDGSRYAYELANDVIPAVALTALIALAESVLAQRERERHAAALEQSLLRAELSNLRLQLQPHFLFNALNTISSTMYDDVDAADAQLGQLAELLRTSLRTTHTHEVSARDELRLLSQYVALLTARFGDRLQVTVDAPADVQTLLVPSMVLQPLVENAVRHGGVSRVGRGRVAVTLRRDGDVLELRVRDGCDMAAAQGGPSFAAPSVADVGGTGLSATARRLRLLYADAQSMGAGPAGNGWEVVLRIPARAADDVPNPSLRSGQASTVPV